MQRVREDFSALFGSTGRPGISTFALWCCAMLAYPLATKGGYAGAVAAAIVFSLSVLFLAYLLGSGMLAFGIDAKRSCLPGSPRLAHRANLLAAALLLPALVLTVAALAGNPVWPAWVAPVLALAIALAGVLAPRRPAFAAGLFLLVVLTACWAASGRADRHRGKTWLFALLAAAIVLLSAALPLLAAVNWRRVIGRGARAQNFALRQAPGTSSSRYGARERQPAAQIVRACLGGTFVQPSRQLGIGAVLLALFIVTAIGLPWLGQSGSRRAAITLALAASGLVLTGFLTQLSNLTRGQIAELALMPGLGAPAGQWRILCRAVLTPPLLWLGVVLLFGSAELLLTGGPFSSVGLLAVYLLLMWLSYTAFALQKLAALPPKPHSFISEFVLLYLVVYASGFYYWVYAAHPPFGLWFWFWVTPALLAVGLASAIGVSVHRLTAAPHPFLSSDSANSRINMLSRPAIGQDMR